MVEDIREIDVAKLDPNPFQPRVEWQERELRELGNSIENQGQIEPIMVRRHPSIPDRCQICVGERRVRACKLVGIAKILAIVRELSDEQMALYVIIENLQRRNLNPIEEAKAFISLETKGWTQEKIAKEVGCGLTRDIVAQRLRLLTFPTELQEVVSRDTITATHAETLATLADEPALLKDAILKVTQQKLTTRETDQLVDELKKKQSLREQILKYLVSEDFVLQFRYLMDAPADPNPCPLCQADDVVYKEDDAEEGLVCEHCGWKYPYNRGPLLELVERIKEARQTEKEPHASGR